MVLVSLDSYNPHLSNDTKTIKNGFIFPDKIRKQLTEVATRGLQLSGCNPRVATLGLQPAGCNPRVEMSITPLNKIFSIMGFTLAFSSTLTIYHNFC